MKQTQGRKLIAMLKRRGMTTMEMLQTGISTCPWKMVSECLSEREMLKIGRRTLESGRTVNVYRVVAITNAKA